MVSTATRNEVWYQLLNASRVARYYGKLSSRMTARNNGRVWAVAFFATSAVVSLLNVLPGWVEIAANVMIGGLALWMLVGNHSQKLSVVNGVLEKCSELETEAQLLWLNLDQLSDSEAMRKFGELEREASRITAKPEIAGVANDEALNQTCAEEAYQVLSHKYAA